MSVRRFLIRIVVLLQFPPPVAFFGGFAVGGFLLLAEGALSARLELPLFSLLLGCNHLLVLHLLRWTVREGLDENADLTWWRTNGPSSGQQILHTMPWPSMLLLQWHFYILDILECMFLYKHCCRPSYADVTKTMTVWRKNASPTEIPLEPDGLPLHVKGY